MKRIVSVALASAALVFAGASPAFAHGEEAQEAWLRMNSVAWLNVSINGQVPGGLTGPDITINQGDTVKITGSAKVLETWPETLSNGDPREAFINVVVPGPVMLVKDRVINGIQAPDSIFVEKGGVYNFEVTIQGRIPGRYHVHPSFAVHGAGTLIGPGQWVTVKAVPGGFKNNITLYNGKTVNLENYKVWWVFGWTFAGFIIGMVWLLWWIWPKPTVSRLAVTSQLSVNDDGGPAVGLVTKRDQRAMDVIVLVTVLFVGVGLLWQSNAFPTKLPLQVDRFRIPPATQPAAFATANATDVILDQKNNTYSMKVTVNNTGTGDATVKALHIANVDLIASAGDTSIAPTADAKADTVSVTPSVTIPAGQSADLTLRMPRAELTSLKLVPSQNANSSVAGVLEVANASGESAYLTVNGTLNYIFASGKTVHGSA
jgi:methane/ammonia monooxygenase subunit B